MQNVIYYIRASYNIPISHIQYNICSVQKEINMVDHLTKEKRSWNMRQIKNRHTKPEVLVRSILHRIGYRFKINDKKLPGKPDIVLPKYKSVIFVHGCFWHRHENCSKATTPKTNRDYWDKKFQRNIDRDKEVKQQLQQLGWYVIVIWECEVLSDPVSAISRIVSKLEKSSDRKYSLDINRNSILHLAEERSKYLIKIR